MAGHSKFKNIMRTARARRIRSARQHFSKLSREITVAAKWHARPDMNPRLRAAVNAAKAASIPRTISPARSTRRRAATARNYEEIRYEGFGPAASASSSRR